MGNLSSHPLGRVPFLRRTLVLSCAALLACACATPEQRAARMQAEMAQSIAIYGPACSQLGYATNSDPWRACVLHLGTREQLEEINNNPRFYGGWGSGHWRGGGYWGPYW